MHPAEQLQGQTSQCVRARVGGEEVASSSSGSGRGSGVGSDAGIYQWMEAERCWLIDIQAVSARAAGGLSARSVGGCGLMGECSGGGRERPWTRALEAAAVDLCFLRFPLISCDEMARCHVFLAESTVSNSVRRCRNVS